MSTLKIVVTGAAGFIGSHLTHALLKRGHEVIAVDNLWTGSTKNIYEAIHPLPKEAFSRLQFFEEDVRDFNLYNKVDYVFHLAALGSVPRSIDRPLQTHQANVDAFFMTLNRARKANVKRFIYASSSSVYGDSLDPLKTEPHIGEQLSPYSASKRINEIYAESFSQAYGFDTLGLRFFNVYGPRQDPHGPYAAVIPKWIDSMKSKKSVEIYGDGNQSRDFTYVKDVVNVCLAAMGAPSDILRSTRVLNVGT
jgi:UDP-N-acetylglucosamine 4-epimerase